MSVSDLNNPLEYARGQQPRPGGLGHGARDAGRSIDQNEPGQADQPEAASCEQRGGLAGLAEHADRSNRSALKRLLDVLGATGGLVLLGPFLILVAVLIRIESPGPALFRQTRTGRGGKTFGMYKFRSMTVIEDGADVVQASPNDGRLTRFGPFLRRSCIDELPQLLNVLKGEMSLVGPRPHAVAHDAYYSTVIQNYEHRHLVRPGIAGLAQVSGHRGPTPTVDLMAARVALDLEYIATWRLASDLEILFRAVTEGPFGPAAF
jgi:lipopolysaccharide/colanic/teichoic acid biosynthesis glycosyltransferase